MKLASIYFSNYLKVGTSNKAMMHLELKALQESIAMGWYSQGLYAFEIVRD